MSLISQYVDISINNRNKTYYKKLGYNIPEYQGNHSNLKIQVNINDVPVYSSAKVELNCDSCNKKLLWSVADYHRRNHDGKTYCSKCNKQVLCSGTNNKRWNDTLSDNDREERRINPEYTIFTRKVLARDDFTCYCCKKIGGKLEVHHLDSYDWCKEKRMDDTNAVTLCHKCHKNFHDNYGKGKNTKQQFETWLGKTIKNVYKSKKELLPTRQVICIENGQIYKNAQEAADINKTQKSRIIKCCMMYDSAKYGHPTKSVNGKHYLYFDVYQAMTTEDLEEYMKWSKSSSFKSNNGRHTSCKQIVCINTKTVFDSISDAAKYYSISAGGITECCKGKHEYFGIDTEGNKLKWMYLNK